MADWLQEKLAAHKKLPNLFPKLKSIPFKVADVTSRGTFVYNCAAYAFKDETKPWWPIDPRKAGRYYYWPDGYPRNNSIRDFFLVFESFGYERCATGDIEEGYEKIAIYVDQSDVPKHLARTEEGKWKSKLGDLQDIHQHTLEAVETDEYGTAKYFMRKPLPKAEKVESDEQEAKEQEANKE
jgi:hypothetical protein